MSRASTRSTADDATLRDLMSRAEAVSENSYWNHSGVPAGAALLVSSGEIFVGCKVDNAAYGSTLAAEKGAIAQMVRSGQREIVAMAVYAPRLAGWVEYEPYSHFVSQFASSAQIVVEDPIVERRPNRTLSSVRPSEVSKSEIQAMAALAEEASQTAHCPFSNFRVGAAIRSSNGKLYSGSNIESSRYDDTVCAERSAVLQLWTDGEHAFDTVVIYTPTPRASPPCGPCRQVLNEFEPKARIVSMCKTQDQIDTLLSELLPGAFGPRNLI